MFITRTKKKVCKTTEVLSCQCDKCKKIIVATDHMEYQEMHHIHFTGGYGSIFGDESRVECDLCQSCLQEMIGKFARIE